MPDSSLNQCGRCANWRLEGPLSKHAYGLCAVRPDPAMRASIATSEQATCRIGRFEAKKQDDAIPVPKIGQRAPQAPSEAQEGPF